MRRPLRVHAGSVEARGFWIDEQLLGADEARARILARWQPETSLYPWLGGYLLILPTPQRVNTAVAPGAVFCDVGSPAGVLSSFEATRDDVKTCDGRDGDVLHLHAGGIRVLRASEATRVDASDWISLDSFRVEPLRSIVAPRTTVPPLAVKRPRGTRKLFGNKVPAESHEAATLRQLLAGLMPGAAATGASGLALRESLGLVGGALRRLFGGNGGTRQQRPAARLSLLSRFMLMSRLSRVAGWRQAGYLRRMLDVLDKGDVDEALRRAIPLGRGDAEDIAWGMPRPRFDLSISGSTRGGPAMLLDEKLHTFLQDSYRRMFQRLDHMGRVDEAAFVLAELLQASEEAVSYLEKHGRLREAAELAEGRELSPGRVVRQWIVAGDPKRAFVVARRTNAFADAVSIFEHHGELEQAAKLRVAWGSSLAEAGRYAAAVDAIWPVKQARTLALDWLERALASGTSSGARALARTLTLLPDRYEETRARVLELLNNRSREAASLREAFANELVAQGESRAASVMARPTYRAILRDCSVGASGWSRRRLERLVKLSNDAALRADTVALRAAERAPTELCRTDSPQEHVVEGHGLIPVMDARRLPRDRLLVALGDAGLRVLNRDGRKIRHFDIPAQSLVLSDVGNRALALMPRTDFTVISRIDLDAATARIWHETALLHFAETYDGSLWFAEIGDRLLAIDALSGRFEALWSTPVPGGIGAMVRDEDSLCLSTNMEGDAEFWRYALPGPVLRERRSFPRGFDALLGYSLRPTTSERGHLQGTVCGWRLKEAQTGDRGARFVFQEKQEKERSPETVLDAATTGVRTPVLTADWTILPLEQGSDVLVVVQDVAARQTRATIRLEDTTHVSAHVDSEVLVLGEGCGRITSLDLRTGHVLHRFQT